jgi:hypothetical protein
MQSSISERNNCFGGWNSRLYPASLELADFRTGGFVIPTFSKQKSTDFSVLFHQMEFRLAEVFSQGLQPVH